MKPTILVGLSIIFVLAECASNTPAINGDDKSRSSQTQPDRSQCQVDKNKDDTFPFDLLQSSLSPVASFYAERSRLEDKDKAFPNNPKNFNLPSFKRNVFDFIIVGSGTAGSILAGRLVQKNFTVLVLEAGGEPPPFETVPILAWPMRLEESFNFVYESQPEKHLKNRTLQTTSGKMYGGSSSHNGGQYERGSKFDYDNWASILEDDEWSYDKVLPYFIRSENYSGQFSSSSSPPHHNSEGWLHVNSVGLRVKPEYYLSAFKSLGYNHDGLLKDPNGPQGIGLHKVEYNIQRGSRSGPYQSFLKKISDNPNLTLRPYSVVSEVLFDDCDKAIGVKYEWHGVPSVAFVKKEVILSAGTFVSPLILIRSGIGPSSQVEAADVKMRVELPAVGKNFRDHVSVTIPAIDVSNTEVYNEELSRTPKFQDFDTYVETGGGPFGAMGFLEAFITSNGTKNKEWADLQVTMGSWMYWPKQLFCNPILTRPKSVGEILYRRGGTDLRESLKPIIHYNFFSEETDFDALIDGIRFCLKLVGTPTFKELGATMRLNEMKECEFWFFLSEREYWKCYIRNLVTGYTHATGTNRMGREGDVNGSVVDTKLRVRGVTGLRIVDASVMPVQPNANIAASVMMIAEKAADFISQDYL